MIEMSGNVTKSRIQKYYNSTLKFEFYGQIILALGFLFSVTCICVKLTGVDMDGYLFNSLLSIIYVFVIAPTCLTISFIYKRKYCVHKGDYIQCNGSTITICQGKKTYTITNISQITDKSKSYSIVGDISLTQGSKVKQLRQHTLCVPKYYDNIEHIMRTVAYTINTVE